MKQGFVSAALGELSFEEVVDFAGQNGFSCVEMACWPKGRADRRYAGVTHIDADGLDAEGIDYVLGYCRERGVEISSLAYYPNMMDGDLEKRAYAIRHLERLICVSADMGIHMVSTFIGRMTDRCVEENLKEFEKVWEPIVKLAEDKKVRIAIENCPMIFTSDEWPGGKNLASTPAIWRQLFSILPSSYLGLNYDPSHFIWQKMDYIRPIYEFQDKIFHVHYKDIKLHEDRLADVGVMAPPLQYMTPRIPGHGDVDWGGYIAALLDIGYRGAACIEIEDKAYEHSAKGVKEALLTSRTYLSQFIGGRNV